MKKTHILMENCGFIQYHCIIVYSLKYDVKADIQNEKRNGRWSLCGTVMKNGNFILSW